MDGNLTASETLQVEVTATNQDPTAQPDAFTVDEDSSNNLLAVLADNGSGPDSDPDGGTLSLTGVTSPGSAGGAITINGDNLGTVGSDIETLSPYLEFEIDFVETGNHQVWLRGLGPNWNGDSVWVALNGVLSSRRVTVPKNAYGWVELVGGVEVNSPGVNTLRVYMREDGVRIDRVLMQPSGPAPSGNGPPESPRDGGGPTNQDPTAQPDAFTVDPPGQQQ